MAEGHEMLDGFGLDEYQNIAMKTAKDFDAPGFALSYGALKLAGEAGEVANELGKVLFHCKEMDAAKIAEELGDVLWYLAFLARAIDFDLSVVAAMNVAKLEKRHGAAYNPDHYKGGEE